jgi:Zn-dependent protease with chaperone function
VLPPVLALGLVAVLAAESMLGLRAGTDHCLEHDHHLHLCLLHGAAWASQAWALTLVVFAGSFVAVRSVVSLWAHAMAQRSASRLRSLGTAIGPRGCYLVPSRERFAFTAGLTSPIVLLSSAAWDALSPAQRDAVVAHELGHVAHGDVWRRAVLGIAASLGAPLLASRLLGVWSLAAERICDRRAALAVGRPSIVASAMLALARAAPPRTAPAGAVFAAASHLPERVHSMLGEGPGGETPSKYMLWGMACAALWAAGAFVLFAEPLHHALETVLG